MDNTQGLRDGTQGDRSTTWTGKGRPFPKSLSNETLLYNENKGFTY